MVKNAKRPLNEENADSFSPKKSKQHVKFDSNLEKTTDSSKQNKNFQKTPSFGKKFPNKSADYSKPFNKNYTPKDGSSKPFNKNYTPKDGSSKPFNKNYTPKDGYSKPFNKNFTPNDGSSKPVDWNDFKKKKKHVQTKRKESKNLYDLAVQAKKIGENLRRKALKGGVEERNKMTNELHEILGGQGHYPKLVMTHDMARIVQYMLKFGSPQIRKDIAKELQIIVVVMLQSKYAKYCVKRMLKYGDNETRSDIVKACYGSAVKLASHAVSAAIFDYAFTTWASPIQKLHLVQEFFGDMYKESKDDSVKHLKDVYEKSTDMKIAALGATKANLQRILNKLLLDSHLVQTVIMQFLQECNKEDKAELISTLSPHIVVLSNSKEGSKAAMICIWHGTNKDRKISIKSLKEHILALSQHEHGHCTIIATLDAMDDTVLMNKILLTEIVSHASELAADEWGRKVLLWLVAPADKAHFHPTFINELTEGRQNSTTKKSEEVRRKELLTHVQVPLLKQIAEEPKKWLSGSSVALVMSAILKAGTGDELKKTFDALSEVITDLHWLLKEEEKEVLGIEHAGLHMVLKKLIQHDKTATENNRPQFGASIVEKLDKIIVKKWVVSNRGCFLLVTIIESDSEDVQNKLKELLKLQIKPITSQTTTGAKILLKKLS